MQNALQGRIRLRMPLPAGVKAAGGRHISTHCISPNPPSSCLQGDGVCGQVSLSSPELCAQQSHQKGHLGTLGSIRILLPECHSASRLSSPHAWRSHAGLQRQPIAGAGLQLEQEEKSLMAPCPQTGASSRFEMGIDQGYSCQTAGCQSAFCG